MRPSLAIASLLLVACAANEEKPFDELPPYVQETRIYLDTVQPETVVSVSFVEPLRYEVINEMYVVMEGHGGSYLLETERLCRPLTSPDIFIDMADRRSIRGRLRAQVDTIRGCRIAKIYKLPPVDETTGPEPGHSYTLPSEEDNPQETS